MGTERYEIWVARSIAVVLRLVSRASVHTSASRARWRTRDTRPEERLRRLSLSFGRNFRNFQESAQSRNSPARVICHARRLMPARPCTSHREPSVPSIKSREIFVSSACTRAIRTAASRTFAACSRARLISQLNIAISRGERLGEDHRCRELKRIALRARMRLVVAR